MTAWKFPVSFTFIFPGFCFRTIMSFLLTDTVSLYIFNKTMNIMCNYVFNINAFSKDYFLNKIPRLFVASKEIPGEHVGRVDCRRSQR